jgi:hypothetical protein
MDIRRVESLLGAIEDASRQIDAQDASLGDYTGHIRDFAVQIRREVAPPPEDQRPRTRDQITPREWAWFYLGYGGGVGGLLYFLILVGTQAARSETEVIAALIFGLLPPLPMLVVGYSLRRKWKHAQTLALAVPVVMGLLVALVWQTPEPTRAAALTYSLAFNMAISQIYFLPGAVVFGLCVLGSALREKRT